MGFYDDIGQLALDVASDKSIGDVRLWYVARPGTEDGVTSAVTIGSVGQRTLYVVPAATPKDAQSAASWPVWDSDFLVFGGASVDVQARDIITDASELAYVISAAPVTFLGFLLAPADAVAVPDLESLGAGAGFRAGLRIGAF